MNRILISFGITTLLINTVVYIALRESLKYHGITQVIMATIGAAMLVFGILRQGVKR